VTILLQQSDSSTVTARRSLGEGQAQLSPHSPAYPLSTTPSGTLEIPCVTRRACTPHSLTAEASARRMASRCVRSGVRVRKPAESPSEQAGQVRPDKTEPRIEGNLVDRGSCFHTRGRGLWIGWASVPELPPESAWPRPRRSARPRPSSNFTKGAWCNPVNRPPKISGRCTVRRQGICRAPVPTLRANVACCDSH